ncbi:MAG: FKBP-type peptidyl-prolyl cis-trans isomerase [Spirosomaceae bacterium]|nr:FKBP-type peptidyl-prolyl cis-trans isomerase [Spirosomataceae bacterium]MDP5141103.1 FKBP-type peptidyl-prolyl cis-trans isomerase [Spirosomataceae bacterium]
MNLKSITLIVAGAALFASCNQFKVTTTEDGDRYQMHEAGSSEVKGKDGDIVTFDLVIKAESNDTLEITNTYKSGEPIQIALRKGPFKGSFENGLYLLSEGDSATIFVNADSLYSRAQQPLPPGITAGSDLLFIVKMRSIKTTEQFAKEIEEKEKGEGKIIDDYVAASLAGATKSEEGIYSVINKVGGGATVSAGDTVTVHYKGTLLTGEEFDSSIGGEPIKFPIGMGYVIPGWEKTLMTMKAGEKRTVVIPSSLAYGANGAGGVIKPFSPLRFEMELVSVSKK